MGLFLLDTRFTISTETRSTTNSVILNALQHASILPSIRKLLKNWFLRVRGAWSGLDPWPRFGISRKKDVSSLSGYQPNSCACEEHARSARNAGSRFGVCPGVFSAPMLANLASVGEWVWTTLKRNASAAANDFYRTDMRKYDFAPVYVLDVTEETPGPVYNLSVEGEPEFFANGILVHNCDSARYGLKSRLASARTPIEQRVAERISAVDPTSRAIWTQKYAAEERRGARAPLLPMRHGR